MSLTLLCCQLCEALAVASTVRLAVSEVQVLVAQGLSVLQTTVRGFGASAVAQGRGFDAWSSPRCVVCDGPEACALTDARCKSSGRLGVR